MKNITPELIKNLISKNTEETIVEAKDIFDNLKSNNDSNIGDIELAMTATILSIEKNIGNILFEVLSDVFSE